MLYFSGSVVMLENCDFWCYNKTEDFVGSCASQPQAEMRYHLGGVPLVTQKRVKLSDVT